LIMPLPRRVFNPILSPMTEESDELKRLQMLLDTMRDLRVRNEQIGRPVKHLDIRIKALAEALDRMSRGNR
jgi:hypothetical protein